MEDTFEFISIVLAIWGILEIILFFKVWAMTDNVEKLKNKFIEGSNNDEYELFVNMDIISSVRALYYLNKKEEAYELLNKYLYYKITYFAKFEVNKRIDGVDYSYVKGVFCNSDEWINNCYREVILLYKALERDIPDNLAPFDYEEYLKFGKE